MNTPDSIDSIKGWLLWILSINILFFNIITNQNNDESQKESNKDMLPRYSFINKDNPIHYLQFSKASDEMKATDTQRSVKADNDKPVQHPKAVQYNLPPDFVSWKFFFLLYDNFLQFT